MFHTDFAFFNNVSLFAACVQRVDGMSRRHRRTAASNRHWFRRVCLPVLCPCCCVEEELAPLRFSHANGISSSDAPADSTSSDVASEACRTQEWCVEHLSLDVNGSVAMPRHTRHRHQQAAGSGQGVQLVASDATPATPEAPSWTPPSPLTDVDLEAAVLELVPKFNSIPSRQLIDAARRSPGLSPVLTAAQVAADRAPTDAVQLVRTGAVQWLRDMLNRADARRSPTITHRLCYTLRAILEHTPTSAAPLLQAALLTGSRSNSQASSGYTGEAPLPELLCRALKVHATSSGVVEVVCVCLGLFSERGAGPQCCQALVAAGGVQAIMDALAGAPDDADLQAAGCGAMLGLMSASDTSAPDAEARDPLIDRIVDAGAVRRFACILERHPHHTSCTSSALKALARIVDAAAPDFVELWPELEAELEQERLEMPSADGLQAKVARQMQKASLPILCTAILLECTAPGSSDRDVHALRVLAGCARLGRRVVASQLLRTTATSHKALTSAAAIACLRGTRAGATAACELWALLPHLPSGNVLHQLLAASSAMREGAGTSGAPTDAEADEFGRRDLTAVEQSQHAAWCAALVVSLRQSEYVLEESPIDALMHTSLRSGRVSGSALAPSLRVVVACLGVLPTFRGQDATEGLCASHGLLNALRKALKLPESSSHRASGVAAACAAMACLVRTGGPARSHALAMPVFKRPSLLFSLLQEPALLKSARVQAAACDLIDAAVTAGKYASADAAGPSICAVLLGLGTHGTGNARLARTASDALSTCCSTVGPSAVFAVFRDSAGDGQALQAAALVRILQEALKAHFDHPPTAGSIVNLMRRLCLESDGKLRASVAEELRQSGLESVLRRLVAADDHHMRGVGARKLLAALK